jgi:hypothetical protein
VVDTATTDVVIIVEAAGQFLTSDAQLMMVDVFVEYTVLVVQREIGGVSVLIITLDEEVTVDDVADNRVVDDELVT